MCLAGTLPAICDSHINRGVQKPAVPTHPPTRPPGHPSTHLPADVLHNLVLTLTRHIVACRHQAGSHSRLFCRANTTTGARRQSRPYKQVSYHSSGGGSKQQREASRPPLKMIVGFCQAGSSAILRRTKNRMWAPRRAMKAAGQGRAEQGRDGRGWGAGRGKEW